MGGGGGLGKLAVLRRNLLRLKLLNPCVISWNLPSLLRGRFGKFRLRMAEVSPRSSPLRDVSRGGTSATQRQKFHTDDVKSVRIRSEALIGRQSSFIVLAIVYEWQTKDKFAFETPWLPDLLCKHWLTSLVWNFCRWVADVPLRETSISGDELGETSSVRRVEKLRGKETVRVSFVEEILPPQDSGLRNISYTRYPKKCFTQIYRDRICIETPCWCLSGWINSYGVWIFVTSCENQQLFWLYPILFSMNRSCDFELQRAFCCFLVIHISFYFQDAFR